MRILVLLAATTLTLLGIAGVSARGAGKEEPCGTAGEWRVPDGKTTQPSDPQALADRLARQQVVLLGEMHDSAEDHRWQLHMLAQLHSRQPKLALGLEMFPRRLQPILDQWVAGELAEDAFLQRSEWDKVWGYDARDYLPLFHFARMHRLPMLALNVERSLPEAIGKQGWENVPETQKEGVSRPAAPSAAYRKELRQVFNHHPAKERGEGGFPRFVEAQTVWDRAMAEVIARHLKNAPGSLVVGILGAGHVRNGHGVEHQLKDLGIGAVAGLITWPRDSDCRGLGGGFAAAMFLVEPPKSNAPRLGVATTPEAGGLRIGEVKPGSIAEAAGLQRDDLITRIAGQPANDILSLRQAVQRQPAGTWLPLQVKRGETELEVVARFPAPAASAP
ncbi:MAG: ChaN family lipoprotein [Rhodocyclaceae bacterium]|nr:ChaN family lipoprotein [Rhodocyclaceae bacterium]MDZ4216130.1 ChaN family lipoprotein [Rhodocyclaceae bacterium]